MFASLKVGQILAPDVLLQLDLGPLLRGQFPQVAHIDVRPCPRRTYGRERAIRPNKVYILARKGFIASLWVLAVAHYLHDKFPRIAGTGTFTSLWSR